MLTTKSIKILNWITLVILGFSFFSFGRKLSINPPSMNELISSGLIQSNISIKNQAESNLISIVLVNVTNKKLHFMLPAGTTLYTNDQNTQTHIQLEDLIIHLEPGEERTLETRCLRYPAGVPESLNIRH